MSCFKSISAFVLIAASAHAQSQPSDSTCVVQPFCSRLTDCCSAHSECFSMCCAKSGECIETKFCYNTELRDLSTLIATPSLNALSPSVNSTRVPYLGSNDETNPCFMYAQFNETNPINFRVGQAEVYEEPQVFAQEGSILTLSNY